VPGVRGGIVKIEIFSRPHRSCLSLTFRFGLGCGPLGDLRAGMPVPARYLLAFTGGLVCLDRSGRSLRLRRLWCDLGGCYAGLCLSALERECRQSVRLCERQPVLLNRGRGRCVRASNDRSRSSIGPQRKQRAQEQQTKKGEQNGSRHRNHLAVPSTSQTGARFRALRRLSASPGLGAAQQAGTGRSYEKRKTTDPSGKSALNRGPSEARRPLLRLRRLPVFGFTLRE
jgi:hypothetical protein